MMMMNKNDKRLSDLEAASGKPGGHLAIYRDPDQPDCYWEKYPFGPLETRGKRYSQNDVQALEAERELVIINFVKEWRPSGEHESAI